MVGAVSGETLLGCERIRRSRTFRYGLTYSGGGETCQKRTISDALGEYCVRAAQDQGSTSEDWAPSIRLHI